MGIPIHCCVWAGDRAALAQKYNVLDNAGCCGPCCSFLCCTVCLLTQELNHIAANAGRQGPTSIVISQQQPVQQVMAAPYAQQPVMAPYGQPVPQNFAQPPPPAYAQQPQSLYPPQPQGYAPQQQPQYPPPPQNLYPPQQMQG